MDRRELLNDQGVAMRAVLQGWQAGVWTALPGMVTKFNSSQMTCEVQPLLQALTRDQHGTESWVSLPVLVDCPVVFPSGGGFTLTFPIAVGDECLVVFSSRCIDSWWQSGGIAVQSELRLHDLSDGFVIPGPKSLPHALPSISTTDVQLRSNDGTAFVGIKPSGEIDVVTPGALIAHAGTATVTATSTTINGNVTINGSLAVTGHVTANDLGTPLVPSYANHVHGGVRSDAVNENTAPPFPGS